MRRIAVAALLAVIVAAPAAEYVIRDPEKVKELLAISDTVAFKDAQLAGILEWLNARYQVETAMGLDAAGKPDVEHAVEVQPTLTVSGEMKLSELLDLAAVSTGWSWSVDANGTIVFLPPAEAEPAEPAQAAPAPAEPPTTE